MEQKSILKHLKNFLDTEKTKDTKEKTEKTEIETISQKDGIVEKIEKKFITNDGRQLLQD